MAEDETRNIPAETLSVVPLVIMLPAWAKGNTQKRSKSVAKIAGMDRLLLWFQK